ncbi:MAG: glycosyltransferase family 2 protein [Bacilli bacterium]|nr:glycosyltransferase family 2 protein [Bacilli bacterium]
MRDDDLISIIVPMYNVEKYVEKCLMSLIKQTYKNIKILAISDGSLDKSYEIALEISKKDKRIECIKKENGGYGSVLEFAINRINSKYFLICDPDDWLDEKCIETLYMAAKKYDADIVCGDKYFVYSDNSEIYPVSNMDINHPIDINKLMSGDEAKKIVLLNTTPHSKMFKTEIAKNIIFPKKVNYTDFLLFTVCSNRVNKSFYINKPLAYYLVDRVGNSVGDYSKKAFDSKIIVFNSTVTILKKEKFNNNYISFKLYNQIRSVIIPFASKMPKSEKEDCMKKIIKCINLLSPYKDKVYNYLKLGRGIKNIINIFIFMLLFNSYLNKVIIKFLFFIKK